MRKYEERSDLTPGKLHFERALSLKICVATTSQILLRYVGYLPGVSNVHTLVAAVCCRENERREGIWRLQVVYQRREGTVAE